MTVRSRSQTADDSPGCSFLHAQRDDDDGEGDDNGHSIFSKRIVAATKHAHTHTDERATDTSVLPPPGPCTSLHDPTVNVPRNVRARCELRHCLRAPEKRRHQVATRTARRDLHRGL